MTIDERYAIVIISHKRADDQRTLKSMREANYRGDWYIMIDDQDPQGQKYIENYGDHVVIYDKERQYGLTDSMDNFHKLCTDVYARNAVMEWAKGMGYKYVFILDDDITHFRFRFARGEKLLSAHVTDLTEVTDMVYDFLESTNALAFSFAGSNGMFGGAKGSQWKTRLDRRMYQAMFIRVCDKRFSGTQNCDENFCMLEGKRGAGIFQSKEITISTPERGSNAGGISEAYQDSGMYVANFYSILCMPSSHKLKPYKKDFHCYVKRSATVPMILNPRWKK